MHRWSFGEQDTDRLVANKGLHQTLREQTAASKVDQTARFALMENDAVASSSPSIDLGRLKRLLGGGRVFFDVSYFSHNGTHCENATFQTAGGE